MTTPFGEQGELDLENVRKLVHWLMDEGMHGLVVAGTTGEWFSMTSGEKAALFEAVSAVVAGEIPLIAGCNAFTAIEAIRNAEAASKAGFDGILLAAPPYVRPSRREIIAFYEDVNASTPLPICIYNWPPGTNIDMSRETLEHLADLDMVVAIKNSTGDREHFLDVMNALNGKVRIFGVPMSELGADLVCERKADGTMGAGAVLGRTHPGFFDALWAGDRNRARNLGELDECLLSEWFRPDYTARFGSAQAIFKTALNLQGLPGGCPRRPILPLRDNEVNAIRGTLAKLGRL